MIAPAAIPPPTTLPIDAMPDAIAAPPAVPAAPAVAANAAPVVPAVADIIVAAEAPTTVDAVVAAVAAVAAAPTPPTTVEPLTPLLMRAPFDDATLLNGVNVPLSRAFVYRCMCEASYSDCCSSQSPRFPRSVTMNCRTFGVLRYCLSSGVARVIGPRVPAKAHLSFLDA